MTRTLGTGTFFKIRTQHPGNMSAIKCFSKTAGNLSGMIAKWPGKSSRTRTMGTDILFKIGGYYSGDLSGTQRLSNMKAGIL